MSVRVFGQVDGVEIQEITIRSAAGAEAKILTWGAVLRDLVVPTSKGPQRVVVGFNTIEDYISYSSHAGAIAGRYANRIANGTFTLDGKTYTLTRNQDGKHTSHGGGKGEAFGKRAWTLAAHDASSVTLSLHSPDGDAGFPGALDVRATYRMVELATLRIEIAAKTDAPTVINFASHSYFHLDLPPGFSDGPVPSSLDHEFVVSGDFYTPLNADWIPTGEIRSVADTEYDFRTQRRIRTDGVKYDIGFVLRDTPYPANVPIHAGTLRGPATGMTMQVYTTEPHLQFYDAAKFNAPVPGLDGARYGANCGICLEPQHFPDSPNHRHFPSTVLRPGETYEQVTEYRFG